MRFKDLKVGQTIKDRLYCGQGDYDYETTYKILAIDKSKRKAKIQEIACIMNTYQGLRVKIECEIDPNPV